jgi:hypothetical protein
MGCLVAAISIFPRKLYGIRYFVTNMRPMLPNPPPADRDRYWNQTDGDKLTLIGIVPGVGHERSIQRKRAGLHPTGTDLG